MFRTPRPAEESLADIHDVINVVSDVIDLPVVVRKKTAHVYPDSTRFAMTFRVMFGDRYMMHFWCHYGVEQSDLDELYKFRPVEARLRGDVDKLGNPHWVSTRWGYVVKAERDTIWYHTNSVGGSVALREDGFKSPFLFDNEFLESVGHQIGDVNNNHLFQDLSWTPQVSRWIAQNEEPDPEYIWHNFTTFMPAALPILAHHFQQSGNFPTRISVDDEVEHTIERGDEAGIRDLLKRHADELTPEQIRTTPKAYLQAQASSLLHRVGQRRLYLDPQVPLQEKMSRPTSTISVNGKVGPSYNVIVVPDTIVHQYNADNKGVLVEKIAEELRDLNLGYNVTLFEVIIPATLDSIAETGQADVVVIDSGVSIFHRLRQNPDFYADQGLVVPPGVEILPEVSDQQLAQSDHYGEKMRWATSFRECLASYGHPDIPIIFLRGDAMEMQHGGLIANALQKYRGLLE